MNMFQSAALVIIMIELIHLTQSLQCPQLSTFGVDIAGQINTLTFGQRNMSCLHNKDCSKLDCYDEQVGAKPSSLNFSIAIDYCSPALAVAVNQSNSSNKNGRVMLHNNTTSNMKFADGWSAHFTTVLLSNNTVLHINTKVDVIHKNMKMSLTFQGVIKNNCKINVTTKKPTTISHLLNVSQPAKTATKVPIAATNSTVAPKMAPSTANSNSTVSTKTAPSTTVSIKTVPSSKKPKTAKKPTTVPITKKPTTVLITKKPTTVPITKKSTVPPTKKPTTVPPTKKPTTVPPTKKPTTVPPTKKPTTVRITKKPTTVPPTKEPTTHPVTKQHKMTHGKYYHSKTARAVLLTMAIIILIVVTGLVIYCRKKKRLSNLPAYYNDIVINDPLKLEINSEYDNDDDEINDDDDELPLFS